MASILREQLLQETKNDDRRSVELHLHDDGGLQLNAIETGPEVQNFWGTENYEYWVNIPLAELGKLAFHLLRERYAGQSEAAEELRAFCERNGIDHRFEEWF